MSDITYTYQDENAATNCLGDSQFKRYGYAHEKSGNFFLGSLVLLCLALYAFSKSDGLNAWFWISGALFFPGIGCCLLGLRIKENVAALKASKRKSTLGERWWNDYPWDAKGIAAHNDQRARESLPYLLNFMVAIYPLNAIWFGTYESDYKYGYYLIALCFDLVIIVGLFNWYKARFLFKAPFINFKEFPFFTNGTLEVNYFEESQNTYSSLQVRIRYLVARYEKEWQPGDSQSHGRYVEVIKYDEHYGRECLLTGSLNPARGVTISFGLPEGLEYGSRIDTEAKRVWIMDVCHEGKKLGSFLLPIYPPNDLADSTV